MSISRMIAVTIGALMAFVPGRALSQQSLFETMRARLIDETRPDQIVGGFGAFVISRPYRDLDNEVGAYPLPILLYRSQRFEVLGSTLTARVHQRGPLTVSAIGTWRTQGYQAEDSPYLVGMDDARNTLELGARAQWIKGPVTLTGQGQADVLSRHGGHELSALGSVELSSWRPLSVQPTIGVRYYSGSLSQYYFGVENDEAATLSIPSSTGPVSFDRAAYDPGNAFLPVAGVSVRQAFTPRLAAVAGFEYAALPGPLRDSPIIEDAQRTLVFLGAVYLFGGAE